VVAVESAHLDNVASEIKVNSDHVHIHRHPASILEVRRVLLEHLDEVAVDMAQVPQWYSPPPPGATTIPISSPLLNAPIPTDATAPSALPLSR
jgi:hypothetical protein